MTQSPIKLARLLAIAWCAAPLATAGCARHKPAAESTAPAPVARVPILLRVTNSNWSDVRIYLVRGSMWMRLGTVTTNSTVEFSVPADYLSGASTVTLVAAPVAGRTPWTTPLPVVAAVPEIDAGLATFPQYPPQVARQ